MSGPVRRFFRAVIFSLVLVPVCVVFAGEGGISWRVRVPVIKPLDSWSGRAEEGSAIFVADLKRPVNDVVLKAEPFEPVGEPGPKVRAVVSDEIVHQRVAVRTSAESIKPSISSHSNTTPVILASSDVNVGKKTEVSAKEDSPEELESPKRSSVSLIPSENIRNKEALVSGDSGFFTTPKRAAGLSGKVVKITPILRLREMYDSNVDYKKFDDLISEITPALKVDIYDEAMQVNFRGDFIYKDYLNHSELDRYDYNLDLSAKYSFSPDLQGALELNHKRYHNLDQNTYESGGVDLDPTIILKTSATPSLNWRIGEKDNLVISNYIDKTNYERKSDSDYLTNVLSFIWGHALDNERTTLYVGEMNTFTHFSREIDDFKSDQISFQGIVGIDHQFTEGWKLSVKGGPGITSSNYSSDTITGDSLDFLYQFRAELGYRELEFSVVPAIERTVRPGRYGENEIFDQAEIYFRYEFSEYLTLDNINTYWMNESDGKSGGRKHKAKGVFSQAIVNWKFEKDWTAYCGLSVNYSLNEISDSNSERFKSWVGFSYSFPTEIN
ncbi:hypothetical protein [Maridesulfovibrio salexigens]|uniref:Uncharacterized protein n=1 Tax=Maridesulfovibrio salexigens (strain ATCC 14822 / DSM 2638 / NCIMB 8403 / VKM B-1763) TaxID=526222 RepID=C6BXH5_MARSD|nr:hypothetical protein [Maridesulfovibrio salexigens]ACS80481.1 hypothetical protein Desal_2425 [Maridesulfovibrio salexigens DSM 2638]